MCLITFAWRAREDVLLAVAANRDEFFARPTAPAAFWSDAPDVLAGRDLVAGGTWLGVTRTGRFAALTNFRDATAPRKSEAASRGLLVGDFLRSEERASDYVARVQRRAGTFEGFNLLLFDGEELWSFSNVEGEGVNLSPGVYGLSNHLLETPWPKVVTARERLAAALAAAPGPPELEDGILYLLKDSSVAPDDALPETGLPLAWERALSAAFVVIPDYGTRASTSVVLGSDGTVRFVERSFGPGGAARGETREAFRVSAPRAPRPR